MKQAFIAVLLIMATVNANAQFLFRINPMYYVINGYRDSICRRVPFTAHPWMTLYFWGVTAVLFLIGTVVFKRLKVHFADVL